MLHCPQWPEEGLIHNRHSAHLYGSGGSKLITEVTGDVTRILKDRGREAEEKDRPGERVTGIGISELVPISHCFFRDYI